MKFKALFFLLTVTGLMLTSCGGMGLSTPTQLPTIVLGSESSTLGTPEAAQTTGGGASASGKIVPASIVQLAAPASASIQSIDVSVGDWVKAGQNLAQLSGAEQVAAEMEAANMELLSAQQDEKALQDNAEKDLAAANLRLANAQKALDDAEKRREYREFRNGTQSQIDGARANVILANNALSLAEGTYSSLEGAADDDVNKAAALNALSAARLARDKAVANLNYLLAMPNQIDVNQVEANLEAAQAELDAAQKQCDLLKNGPNPDELALVNQRIKNAKAQAAAAQSLLNDLTIKAPFNGTVSKISVHLGEWVLPGQDIMVVADLDNLLVETTDLSERNVSQVKVGQKASLLIKPLSQNVDGQVKEISPLADTLGGDVVYKTVITLDTLPEGIRPGMSVDVSFENMP